MTKPITPTLAICLAASAVMVGALFADPDEPKSSGLDETSASQSAEPTPSADEPSDGTTSEATDHESREGGKDKRNESQPTDETTEPTEPSTEPTPVDPGETASEKPDDYDGDRGDGADGSHAEPPPADYTMTINGPSLPSITVAPGDVVKVVNNDDVPHTVTAVNGSFTTDNIPAGKSRTFTAPADPGSYDISCKYHAEMTATVTVS